MSNAYDDWKTESPDEEHDRLYRGHAQREEPIGAEGGVCACGAETERSVAGIGWQCRPCSERQFQASYLRRMRTA